MSYPTYLKIPFGGGGEFPLGYAAPLSGFPQETQCVSFWIVLRHTFRAVTYRHMHISLAIDNIEDVRLISGFGFSVDVHRRVADFMELIKTPLLQGEAGAGEFYMALDLDGDDIGELDFLGLADVVAGTGEEGKKKTEQGKGEAEFFHREAFGGIFIFFV